MSDNNMGLRQKVKKGIVSLDEAIELAKDYNENIQRWLRRRKEAGIKSKTESDQKPKRRRNRKKSKKNA